MKKNNSLKVQIITAWAHLPELFYAVTTESTAK